MDEILKKLLESEMLSEDVKTEIAAQWTESVSALRESYREEALLSVRQELSEQWIQERDTLIESLEVFASEKLEAEMTDLKEDIERFRDLEAEYAQKLVEEKQNLAVQLQEDLESLIDKIDDFFEERIAEELSELKEDISLVRENEFGRKVFESFVKEFNASFVDEKSIQRKLAVTTDKLSDTQKTIAKLEESVATLQREKKMDEVLSQLAGQKREQMAFILSTVATEKLSEAYSMFIGRVLREDAAPKAETLTESKQTTTLVTGDAPASTGSVITEQKTTQSAALLKTLRLAGVKQ